MRLTQDWSWMETKRIIPSTYQQARDLADLSRGKAYAVLDEHRLRESTHRAYWRERVRHHWWQVWRPPSAPLTLPFDIAVDRRVAADPRWRSAIADNQWYIQYATMYAQGEQRRELELIRANLDIMVERQYSPVLNRTLQRSGQ